MRQISRFVGTTLVTWLGLLVISTPVQSQVCYGVDTGPPPNVTVSICLPPGVTTTTTVP
jgi:hypothetical protein